MKSIRKLGFSLVEMLAAIAVGALALVGMFEASMAYLAIWKETAGSERCEQFNREVIMRRFIANELSTLVFANDKAECNDNVTFRKLNGEKAIPGNDEALFYWHATQCLPFVEDNQGGITECWLKFEGNQRADDSLRELRLYYRTLKPDKKPDSSGSSEEVKKYFTLLEKCKGIRFGYSESLAASNDLQFLPNPKFSNGKDPDLPQVIQILLPE
jgi:prepilin-type N-terminal cleavage/methylation domain-containing protein